MSQSKILDKPYIRESPIRYSSSYISYHYRNSIFALEQPEEILNLDKVDSILDLKYNLYSSAPLKINDCVYFTPNKKFISKYIPSANNKLIAEKEESFFYLNTNYFNRNEYKEPNLIFPNSIRFYVDTSNISIIPKHTEMVLDSSINIPLDNYLKPFYFRKYEVTNLEYREFVNWVRDSIARKMLFDGGLEEFGKLLPSIDSNQTIKQLIINWKPPILWDNLEYKEILEPLFLNSSNRFFKKESVDPRKLNYLYYPIINNVMDRILLNVYPDTLCWVHDFNWSFNEPMTQNYFWHPAYNDYPVVGINYYQALAFLNWKTLQHQAELDAKGIKLKVEYDLPTEAEWDIAATAEMDNKKINIYTKNYYSLADNSWITDLSLTQSNITHTDSIKGNNHYISTRSILLSDELKSNYRYKSDYKIDGAFYTHKSNINLINKKKELVKRNELTEINQDNLGICFMGGNVSEWLKESYQENWKPIFELRQRLLKTFEDKDIEILSSIEKYYDENNHPKGKLVRGSNWYDERFSNKLGKNTAGINAKVFVSPDSTYSTLGFRYVVHFKRK